MNDQEKGCEGGEEDNGSETDETVKTSGGAVVEAEEVLDDNTSSIPILQLVQQLLRNGSSHTLQQLQVREKYTSFH